MQKIDGTLTNLQLEILKMFNYDLPENQLLDIRSLLANYFADKATSEMDDLWEVNEWTEQTIEKWSEEHMRGNK